MLWVCGWSGMSNWETPQPAPLPPPLPPCAIHHSWFDPLLWFVPPRHVTTALPLTWLFQTTCLLATSLLFKTMFPLIFICFCCKLWSRLAKFPPQLCNSEESFCLLAPSLNHNISFHCCIYLRNHPVLFYLLVDLKF